MINTLKGKILTYFKEHSTISKDKLVECIIVDFPELKKSTINVYLSRFKKEGIINNPLRGVYSLENNEVFNPKIDTSLKRLYHKIQKQYPYIIFCVWNTKWLNEFMLHQPFRFYTILEVEKEAMESVFYALKEQGKEVFLNPSQEITDKYVVNANEPIIITQLITEAPTQKVNKMVTQTIEKLLVDIYCDPILFAAQQGAELKRIYQTAYDKYNVNNTKMFRYASRRNKREKIENFINSDVIIWQQYQFTAKYLKNDS